MKPMRTIILLAAVSVPLAAQAPAHQTRDGKPNLTAPAPRLNGKPDLTGVWEAERTSAAQMDRFLGNGFSSLQVDYGDLSKYAIDVFWGMKREEEPLQPAAVAILKQRAGKPDPPSRCLPGGIPANLLVYSLKIIQTPQELVMLPGSGDPPREIYTDGRGLPASPEPTWAGSSVGKWRGDLLLVETTGFKEESWLDGVGHPRSESMHIRETYRRRDSGHLDLEVTIEDPKYYTKPANFKTTFNLIPGGQVLEFVCGENEKDRAHIAAR